MTDYLRLAQQNALPQQDDAGDNPYLSIAREQQALQQWRARTIIETALKDDPELAAERQRLSQTSGLPLRVIERNLEEVRIKERAKAIDLVRMANESPVLYRQLTDPTFTTTAIDDLGTLEKIERAVGKTAAYVMGADGRGGLPADLGGAAKTVGLGATVGIGKMLFDVAGVVNDLIGWDSGAAAARQAAKRAQEVMDEYGFEGGTSTRDAIRSGLQSAGTNLALLPVGLARNLWTTANQAASAVAGLMSVGVGADAFNRAREQGRSELQAGIYAIPEAAFEFVFERIPASKLFGDIAANETLLRMLGKQMFSEGWTEQVTTLAQDFNEWMNLNQDKTLADYIAERPEAAYQTFVATLVGVGVQTSTIKSIDKIIEKASQQKLKFELDQFNEQLALASQSMLRQRSPEQFRALVQRIVDENTDTKKEIYVDGQVLNQLPADVLAQLPEAVREQIPEAAATNSVVAIPMADVLTVAPGTPLEQILNDNARMTPESLSRVEAQQASEQAQEFLEQEAERVLAQAADQAAWQQSANTVKQTILDQLNQAGRFTSDVNEAYATLQAHFFSSMAARLGITPAELYQRYALKVAAQSPGGQVLDAPIAVYDQGEVTVTDQVDERTGLPLNSDGTVTLYHHTSAANAEAIKKSGMLKSAGEPDVYLTTREIPDTGYGDTVVRVRIDPAKLQLDDEFPDGRKDFRVHVGRPGGALRDAQFDQAPTGRPNYQTTYTDPQGETYEIRLTQEVFGVGDGRELTVQVGAFQNGQRRARVDFELQGNTLAAGNTVVAPAYRRRGLAEAMYRAAREAGYDIMPGRKQTAAGERLVARLREKGVINRERPLEQGVALPAGELPETIEVDGVQRPTRNSNGQPIHPTEEGIRNFWRWFADSKVVDAEGKPLVVYHGTTAEFDAFRDDIEGRAGFYFTDDIKFAQQFADGDGANVMPVYLSISKPADLRSGVPSQIEGALEEMGYSRLSELLARDPRDIWNHFDGDRELSDMLQRAGYDGLRLAEPEFKRNVDSWVAFQPEQIKSATGNRGTFDPANPSILSQGPRGTFDPKQLLITLNENADLSTFLHESGHFFLEVLADLASQPNAPQQIVDDMATILKWFGIKGDEQVGGSDSGAPLAQQDAEAVSEAIYKEMAADDELVAALEAWMVDGTQPDAATNEKLLGYMRRMPPVPRDSYLTFYRGQPRGAAPHSRGWASWTTNPDTTRFFTEGDSEVLQRKGVQGISLEQIALWRTRLTGELTDYGSQGEWLVLNESVFAQGGDLPTDTTKPAGRTPLEVWNAMTLDQKRPYHERWAEAFEQYLFEGKAPSQELQPLFRRFRSWLINVYKSLKQFMLGRNLQLGDDIRKVFDRLIATDEEIAQAEEAAGMLPDFEATNEAIEKLQARSLRDLKWAVNARNKTIKALQKQAAKLRKEVEAEVRAEVEQQPVYRAMRWLKKGETVDPETGDLVKAEKGYRLSADALAEMYPETMLARPDLTRLRGMTAKNGLHPDLVADMFGFASGDALVRAIIDAAPISEVIEGMTDQRMLERHGDLVDQRAIEEAANEAVHNEARARALATELKAQTEMLNPRQATGRTASNGRPITVNAITEAAKQFAQNLAARRRVKDLRNAAHQHRAAEARAAKRWQQATAKGDTQAAVQAKRDQLLNNYAAKALQDAQAEAKKILEFFRKVTKGNNEKIVERGRDPDVVNAMRAILAAYGVAPRLEKSALEYMEVVAKNDPAMYAALKPSVDAALFNAKPLDELTMEELRGLNDELRAMWDLAKRSRQMEVDGNLMDIEDAADELVKRMEEIGIPAEIPGERGAITDREEAGIKLQYAKAFLSRVEQWTERMDGKFGGPFLRLVFQPIKEAADAYRTARVDYRKRFTALVENIAPILRPGAIHAPELNYTFGNARDSGQAELLHAILHTGNESNRRKLLLGRGWATELEDGTLDTSRWDAFIARMINEGKITKAHYDFAQGVWDLLEEMKPLAQETHRKVFGRYFAEVTATPFDTPFGSYRGGYVPAQTDPRMVKDAKLRELAEAENESMAYAFPASPSGFTKSRVEYNKPLLLDLRALAQHIDKVLLFSYMQGPVTDVRRLLTNKRVSYALDRIDPGAYEAMLIPWLNRAAKQIVETPVAGDRKLSRFLSAARNRAGMALMFANLSNTVQQITGFSMAAVKVKPSLMMKATASFIADPKAMKEQVATASEYMRNRMLNEVAAMNDAVEQILVNATKLEKAKDWTQRHAYFLQVAVDNTMSPIIWTAAYNQAIEQKMSHKDAVRFADGVIRQTQGTSLPEDISRFESGPAPLRLFTQFIGYFNMMANTNATAVKQIVDEMGLRKGAGRLLYVALAGLLVPIWVAEAIAMAFRGGPDDEDDDGYLDDWLMAVFGLGTLRGMVAQVPIVGQAAQLAVNRFNDSPADDKFSLSPAVSLLESAVSSPASVYKAIVDEGSAQKAVRDVAAAATLITGLPIYAAARPIGYLAGMADERIEPTGPVDLARGLVTGTASPESKVP